MEPHQVATMAVYERDALTLQKKYLDLQRYRLGDIDRFLESVPGKRILELGAGPGVDGALMQKRAYKVTCSDLSESMLALCAKQGLPTLRLDLENLQLPKESYDGIYAAACFLHVPRQKLATSFERVAEALAPKGAFFLSLKQGTGERYDSTGRFFTYWDEEEVFPLLNKQFTIIHNYQQHEQGYEPWIKIFCEKR